MGQPHLVVYSGHTPVTTDSDPAAALAQARSIGGMLWLSISQPTPEQIRELAATFALEPLGVASILRGQQRSKLTRVGEHLFVVAQPAQYDDAAETVECHAVDVIVGDDFFIALAADPVVDLERMRALLEEHSPILDRGPYGVLWGMFEYVTRGYRDVLDGVEHDIDEIEEQLFGDDEGVSRRIFALQREVIDLWHATAPLDDILQRLERVSERRAHTADAPGFRELAERARFVNARVSGFRGTLDNALTIHATLVDQRRNEAMQRMTETSIEQNDQVKKISSWAAIGFAPTLVAGIYGMNFQHMPELSWMWGYPFAIALMAAVSVGLYIVFKKRDWL
ncbi:magnesium and cobalt transport protein CorA [Microbacterium dextranolyticum]|uniref:Magnesium transport protein CorA n=1 Tax=Microbacterium dextranolyticum TaxID=36806 RepID=A0A9W6M652_9MICO|nr:magnesium and cobalt transport protein CorA [Microbacterium dextranolyticum]MBM7463391.1 magnesium transporter [Microbacterium dextranolyticum]GLJ95506.1 magnesium transport protein CorA [Microbacterium dextranolyticum]